ncbi:hypothetical protein F0562_008473 [Nyssa sinensis]|uniref:RING-type E3 ubiquitin transferase n=1 Tax=Nyssa sinensis TaxID=561372 RepID=A0A5J5A7Y3_9ASTE|nr:hypothetical protein F0562_008473 [Nyssa sinensis]
MERNHMLQHLEDVGQRNMRQHLDNADRRNRLHSSQMLNHPGQEQLPYMTHAVLGHNSQFLPHGNSGRNHNFNDSFPDLHLTHIAYGNFYNRQDHLHYAPHVFQSEHSQFLHHDNGARNQNFHDFPDHRHGSISYQTHFSGLQNHQPISVADLGGGGGGGAAAASNFYYHHPIPSSNCRSYPAPLNYHSSVAVHDHNHLVQQSFIDSSFQLSTLNSVEQNHSHPSYANHYWSHQHQPSHPMQWMRGNNFHFQPQIPSSSHRHQISSPSLLETTNPSSGNRNFRSSTSQLYQSDLPQPQGNHYFLLVDSVAIFELLDDEDDLNVPDTQWDDEDISYEELLSLAEEMGHVNTGLSEETITRHLKTRTHVSSEIAANLNEPPTMDQEPEICVICQEEYESNETVGTLQCGHDYHADCIKEWLFKKNERKSSAISDYLLAMERNRALQHLEDIESRNMLHTSQMLNRPEQEWMHDVVQQLQNIRNMLHTIQMLNRPGQEWLHDVVQQLQNIRNMQRNLEDMVQRNMLQGQQALRGHNSQFPSYGNRVRNHDFHDSFPNLHHNHISRETRYNRQDHLHHAPHILQSNNSQFLHHEISARNENFHDFPDHRHGSISHQTHFNGIQNHQPIPVVNFYDHHPMPSSNCRSYPVAAHDHYHPVQQSFIDPSSQLSTLNSVDQHHSHPYHMNNHQSHQHQPPHPMQSMRGNNSYLQPRIPSSSNRQAINIPSLLLDTSNPSWDTGNRNSRPSTSQLYQSDLPQPHGNSHFHHVVSVAIFEPLDGEDLIFPDTQWDDAEMIYEELFSLEEEMGYFNTGLSEETITRHLKTRTHVSSKNAVNFNEPKSMDQEPEICVICQEEYESNETIGTLQCGHDYHADCIKKWLFQINICPVCKSTALTVET